ncbi:MAG: HAD-IA family hydrolase, partial [Oscillospiraceae bacterium]|nr:HAD-IA family hydrolase [Oscillospiraceae bacterium]
QVDVTFLARRGLPYTKEYYEGVAHTILPKAAVFTKAYCHSEQSCEEIIAEWMELAKDSYAHVALKPHARELLEALRAADERLAVFTSAVPVHCRTALAVHGLTPCFEQVVYAHELGVSKDTAEAFHLACRQLGVVPADCVVLDDSVASCRAAKAAGARVIGVYDPYFEGTKDEMPRVCDRYIRSFAELL